LNEDIHIHWLWIVVAELLCVSRSSFQNNQARCPIYLSYICVVKLLGKPHLILCKLLIYYRLCLLINFMLLEFLKYCYLPHSSKFKLFFWNCPTLCQVNMRYLSAKLFLNNYCGLFLFVELSNLLDIQLLF